MKYIFVTLFSILLFTSCDSNKKTSTTLTSLIPTDTEIVIKTNGLEGLKSGLKNNDFIKILSEFKNHKAISKKLDNLKHLQTNNTVLLCFNNDKNDSLNFSAITNYNDQIFNLDSIPNHSIETLKMETKTVSKITINKEILYSTVIDSLFFVSNRLAIVKSAFSENTVDTEFENIYTTTDPNKTLSLFTLPKLKKNFQHIFNTKVLKASKFSDYSMLDIDISQENIILNGITKATDSSRSLINVFKNTIPQENQISKITPPETNAFLSITFNNFSVFKSNLLKFKTQDSTSVLDNVTEVGVLYTSKNPAIFLNSIDASSTFEFLASPSEIESYRNVAIYTFNTPEIFKNNLVPFITSATASKYIQINDYFVFSDDIEFLKSVISNVQNNSTLFHKAEYQAATKNLSDEASLLVYNNSESLNNTLNSINKDSINLNLSAYKASAIQFIYDSNFAHVNAVIQKHKSKRISNSVSEEVTITLDNDLLTSPQLVKNHTNNQKEVIVQDIKNNLYLISNDGKVLWRKQLKGKLLGKVEQIDIYKNGRLQFAFATPNHVYILDRNGKDVTNFPLKFNDKITQPLSVFDYDKKKNYRLLVTQSKALLLYDKEGKKVSGFTYKKATDNISTQPKHFRIGRKDYIVFAQGKTMEILDRTGKPRVKANGTIDFSGNDIYLYNNKFTTTSQNGALVQVNQKGQISSANLNLKEKHKITTTSKTLVTLSENKLDIKSKSVELDYGEYTAPQIFYVNDKIYVTTTDLQAKKIHLYDSQAKSIANFPVYGNSAIELDNIDKDASLEVVTKGDDNVIIIYQIN